MTIKSIIKARPSMKAGLIGLAVTVAGSLLLAVPANASTGSWQKGVSIQSRYASDFGSDSFKQSVAKAKGDGVNFIMLIIPVHQDNIYSSTVYTGSDTPTNDAIASGIAYIRSQGMNAGIAIHDNPYDSQWRALVNPSDTITWFNSYGSLLVKYASILQSNGGNEMVIGTELSTMTRSQNTSNWVSLIGKVRAAFSGSLTYSAQHSGYMGDVNQVGFWGSLDYIGISAYYGLYGRTDQAGMQSAWQDWDNSEVSAVAAKTGKKVIFTEVGFVSRDGATNDPGTGYTLNTSVNAGLQATAYSALFNYWNNSNALAGMFLWDWSSDSNAGGNNDGGYTPQNKPAEAVMKQWYAGSGSANGSVPGGGTATPTPPAAAAPTTYTAALTGTPSATTGNQAANTVSVSSNGTLNDAIVDIEIYDSAGNRVIQTVYDHQAITSAAQNYALNWIPSNAGTYTVKVGIFTSNWSANTYWNNNLGNIAVSVPAAPPQAAVPAAPATPGMGGGSATQTPPVTPAQPAVPSAPPSLPTEINVWWPGAGVTVGGIQPFKSVIDGRDLSTYDMFWQVDGGTLNQMSDVTVNPAHKEALVDLTNWKWNASHSYVITFVAKDKAGTALSQKAVTITIY